MFLRFRKRYVCVRQHDIADCGAACLATVFKHYGLTMSVTKIREMSGTDREGTNAYGMVKAAKAMGFIAKGVRLIKDDFTNDIKLPAIAHVVLEKSRLHYVVVFAVSETHVLVADPAKGIINLTREDFFKIWTGGMILLEPGEEFKKGDYTHPLFLSFFRLILPLKKKLMVVFASSLLYTALGILGSFYVGFLFDRVLGNGEGDKLHYISLGFLILLLLQIILLYIRSVLLAKISLLMDRSLMMQYYRHVLKLPMGFFDTRKVGEIISRFMDAGKIRDAISGATLTLMVDTLMALAGGIILYLQSARLFFISLIIVVIYGVIVALFNKPIREINHVQMENNAKLTSYLVESLEGMETVKAFHAEAFFQRNTESKLDKLIQSVLKGTKTGALLGALTSGVSGTGTLVLLWLGTSVILSGKMTSGELLSFNALLIYFLAPIKNLIDLQSTIQTALVASKRLGEILELEQEKANEGPDEKISPASLYGRVEIRNLTFRYGAKRPVLRNINISIDAGEKVAIVGESGSGKTTLAKLLMKLYLPEEGEIVIADKGIEEIPISILRKEIAFVSQQSFLFAGTIKENLIIGDEQITEDKMIEASLMAQAHSFIDEFPLKYETYLEENGSNLSGGQKQRLAIARAILRDPNILILDEATSNLDSVTEGALENTMKRLNGRVTLIVIAHRLRTIMHCDKIFVLDKGEVAEWGTHQTLMEQRGLYYNMWKMQVLE
ncbi:MAG: peptidase domain-containing ABC transporter [Clostridia bacterium]|nr:peptidase domain-containing ABC transporter [Clostridia bacterium]